MLTMHPTAKRDGNGYRPMINIRRPNGQMLGSRVSHTLWFLTQDAAIYWARIAAQRALQAQPTLLRVAA